MPAGCAITFVLLQLLSAEGMTNDQEGKRAGKEEKRGSEAKAGVWESLRSVPDDLLQPHSNSWGKRGGCRGAPTSKKMDGKDIYYTQTILYFFIKSNPHARVIRS